MAKAYLTFKGTSEGVVDAFYPTQALADAGALGSDIVAVQGIQTIPDDFRPNKAYWDGGKLEEELPEAVAFAAKSSEDQVEERRAYLFGLLRQREAVGGKLAVWHASRQGDVPIGDPPTGMDPDERLDPSKRFASYGRWVEANVRAALVDANLTNEAKWAWLKAECEIDGETWYWLHKVNGIESNGGWYAIYADNDRGEWAWHYTTGSTVTSNSRIGVKPPESLELALDTDADWVLELQ